MRVSANVEFTPEQQATNKAGNPHGHEVSGLAHASLGVRRIVFATRFPPALQSFEDSTGRSRKAAANVSRNLLSDHLPTALLTPAASTLDVIGERDGHVALLPKARPRRRRDQGDVESSAQGLFEPS